MIIIFNVIEQTAQFTRTHKQARNRWVIIFRNPKFSTRI